MTAEEQRERGGGRGRRDGERRRMGLEAGGGVPSSNLSLDEQRPALAGTDIIMQMFKGKKTTGRMEGGHERRRGGREKHSFLNVLAQDKLHMWQRSQDSKSPSKDGYAT